MIIPFFGASFTSGFWQRLHLAQLFHRHRFGPWFDETKPRQHSMFSSMMGLTSEDVWYQRRECQVPECKYAQITRLEKKAK